jgi:hypothetical protein
MSFPLYTSLITNLPTKDLTVLEKQALIKDIATLDTDAHELIYALIKSYYLEHSGGDEIPYNGKIQKDRISFSLLDMPVKLRRLLYRFISLHVKKLAEDKIYQSPLG